MPERLFLENHKACLAWICLGAYECDMANVAITQIRARRQEVRREIEALKVELDELDVAERVLGRFSLYDAFATGAQTRNPKAPPPLPHVEIDPAQKTRGTIEELIRTFLLEHKTGWATASEIKDWLTWRTNRDVPMSTVSPTLSNMKGKSIVRYGLRVCARERAAARGDLVVNEDGDAEMQETLAEADDVVTTASEPV